MQKYLLIINFVSIIILSILLFIIWRNQPVIVSVDSVKLLNEYAGTQSARLQFKEKENSWRANLDTLSNEVTRQRTFNDRNFSKMSPSDKSSSYDILRKKELQLQQYKEAVDLFIRQEESKITNELTVKIDNYLKAYGKEKGYSIILGANQFGNVIYSDETRDITLEVLNNLNKDYK